MKKKLLAIIVLGLSGCHQVSENDTQKVLTKDVEEITLNRSQPVTTTQVDQPSSIKNEEPAEVHDAPRHASPVKVDLPRVFVPGLVSVPRFSGGGGGAGFKPCPEDKCPGFVKTDPYCPAFVEPSEPCPGFI